MIKNLNYFWFSECLKQMFIVVLYISLQGNEKTNSLVKYYESVISKYGCGKANALHLGCGPGYTSLMLSKTFDSVRQILTINLTLS